MRLKVSLLEKIYRLFSKEKIEDLVGIREKEAGETNNPIQSYHLKDSFKKGADFAFILILLDDTNTVASIHHYMSVYVKPIKNWSDIHFVFQGPIGDRLQEMETVIAVKPEEYGRSWLMTTTARLIKRDVQTSTTEGVSK